MSNVHSIVKCHCYGSEWCGTYGIQQNDQHDYASLYGHLCAIQNCMESEIGASTSTSWCFRPGSVCSFDQSAEQFESFGRCDDAAAWKLIASNGVHRPIYHALLYFLLLLWMMQCETKQKWCRLQHRKHADDRLGFHSASAAVDQSFSTSLSQRHSLAMSVEKKAEN